MLMTRTWTGIPTWISVFHEGNLLQSMQSGAMQIFRILTKILENLKLNCLQCKIMQTASFESVVAVLACILPDLRLFKVSFW